MTIVIQYRIKIAQLSQYHVIRREHRRDGDSGYRDSVDSNRRVLPSPCDRGLKPNARIDPLYYTVLMTRN